MKDFLEQFREKFDKVIFENIAIGFPYIGSRVFLNESGKVEAKILTLNECKEAIDKIKSGEVLGDEYSFMDLREPI